MNASTLSNTHPCICVILCYFSMQVRRKARASAPIIFMIKSLRSAYMCGVRTGRVSRSSYSDRPHQWQMGSCQSRAHSSVVDLRFISPISLRDNKRVFLKPYLRIPLSLLSDCRVAFESPTARFYTSNRNKFWYLWRPQIRSAGFLGCFLPAVKCWMK
jgi:hypothetical protein